MPTVPLDPPTAYGLAALLVVVGRRMVEAGQGPRAFRAAVAFSVFFALSVQVFLFRWPDWMYAYAMPSTELAPALVSLPFFAAVAGAGTAGAYVALQLIRAGRTGWAVANALFGIGLWLAIWAATWAQYFHVGTWAEWQQGRALPIAEVPAFQMAMNLAGAAQGAVGVGIAAWLFFAGRRAARRSAIQPDAAGDWRQALGRARSGGAPSRSLAASMPPASPSARGASTAPAPSIAPGSSTAPASSTAPGSSTAPASSTAPGSSASPTSSSTRIEGGMIGGTRPRDGRPLSPVAATPVEEVSSLVARARKAQAAWAALPVRERARRLGALKRRFLSRAEELAAVLEEEIGRPRTESWITEILPNADLFDHWARRGPALLQAAPVSIDPITFPSKRGVIEHLPRGVIGLITPWNFPVALPLRTIMPALLAGNAVVWKPSEHAARSAALLNEILGLQDLLVLVQGGADVGRAIVREGVDHLVFVGSPATGRAISAAAAEALTPVSLELGGKDAALVLHDADLDRTANGVLWGAFANAGQNCAAIERCYVDARVAAPFVDLLRARMAALRAGDDVGPLTTPEQLGRVRAQLEEAGAPAPASDGLYLRPVLVIDPSDELSLLQEETFGPVLPVIAVQSEEEMIRRTNASAYGLTASVWSRDTARAEGLGRRLQAGVVTVNNHAFTGGLAQAPWSGTRGSGAGITNGPQALAALTRPRFVLVDRSRSKRELWWYPYDESVLRLARGLAKLRSGGGISVLPEVIRGFLGAQRRGRSPALARWPGEAGAPALRPIEGGAAQRASGGDGIGSRQPAIVPGAGTTGAGTAGAGMADVGAADPGTAGAATAATPERTPSASRPKPSDAGER